MTPKTWLKLATSIEVSKGETVQDSIPAQAASWNTSARRYLEYRLQNRRNISPNTHTKKIPRTVACNCDD